MSIDLSEVVVIVGGTVTVAALVCITTAYVRKKRADKEKLAVIQQTLDKMTSVVDIGCQAFMKEVTALRARADALESAANSAMGAVRQCRDELRRLLDRRPKIEIGELCSELRPTVSATLGVMAALVGIYDGLGLGEQLRLTTDALARTFDVDDPLGSTTVIGVQPLSRLSLTAN